MGKNQGHKAMQRSRYTGGGGGDEGGGAAASSDGMKDVTFHTAEWHAARIAALQVERMPWEEWRQKQKEAEGKLAAAAEEEERLMRDYRTQLDADRSRLLARGRNHADLARELSKKDKRDKDKDKEGGKKRKRKDSKSEKKSKKSKKDSKDKKKKSKKSKKRRTSDSGSSSDTSGSSSSSSDSEAADGVEDENDADKPMRLSDWLKM